MKSVFIAGSRKFYEEIEKLVQELKDNEIKVAMLENGIINKKTHWKAKKERY